MEAFNKLICYTQSLKQYMYSKYITFWLLTTKSLLVENCSIDRSTVHRSIASFQTVDRWPYFHWFNKSYDIDVILKTSYGYVSGKGEYIFFSKMKMYNKSVIDWLLGQQQFCLTFERIRCPQPADASRNRSILGSNKTVIVLESSQYLFQP